MAMIVALTSLQAARAQMAVSLGFHIVFAALAVGLPAMLLFAEYRANRTGDVVWMALCRRWAKALGILVAVGAVSGTVLSFALGLFWPGLMGRWGAVIGLPFALEAFADLDDDVRQSIARGRPFGSEQWTDKTVKRLGLESTMRPRGRPRVRHRYGFP